MSRASEYEKKAAEAKSIAPPDFPIKDINGDTIMTATVRDDGGLVFVGRFAPVIRPEQALALAKWITDTFGDYGSAS